MLPCTVNLKNLFGYPRAHNRKITLLMKGIVMSLAHRFLVLCCYSFFMGMQTKQSSGFVVVPVIWHHPRKRIATHPMKQQLPARLVPGLYKLLCTLLFLSLNQLNALRTQSSCRSTVARSICSISRTIWLCPSHHSTLKVGQKQFAWKRCLGLQCDCTVKNRVFYLHL